MKAIADLWAAVRNLTAKLNRLAGVADAAADQVEAETTARAAATPRSPTTPAGKTPAKK